MAYRVVKNDSGNFATIVDHTGDSILGTMSEGRVSKQAASKIQPVFRSVAMAQVVCEKLNEEQGEWRG